MASSAEGIGCPTLNHPSFPKIAPCLVTALLAGLALIASGCSGGERPDPGKLLDRAFARDSLLSGGVGPTTVEVASLGYEDRVLEVREVPVAPSTHREILEALASGPGSEGAAIGLVSLARDLDTGAQGEVDGVEVWPVSGRIETDDLLEALEQGGGSGVGRDLGLGGEESLRQSLAGVDFTASVSDQGEDLIRLDLTIALDDPGNSLPPTRIRFRLDTARPADGRAGADSA